MRVRHLRVVSDMNAMQPDSGVMIAFASGNRTHVDQHFGTATGFMRYRIDLNRAEAQGIIAFEQAEQDGDHGKLVERILAVEDCHAVYSNAIGPSAVRQLVGMGVQPLRVPPETTIASLIKALQNEMRGTLSPWLAHALKDEIEATKRFDMMEAEGWQE